MYKKVNIFTSILLVLFIGSIPTLALADDQIFSSGDQPFQPRVWIEDLSTKFPGSNTDLKLDEFPGTIFRWMPGKIAALGAGGERAIIPAGPTRLMFNVFLADLNGDGLPEFCTTISYGSGVSFWKIEVCDYSAGKLYELPDSTSRDMVTLSMKDGQLFATQAELFSRNLIATGKLAIINDKLVIVGP